MDDRELVLSMLPQPSGGTCPPAAVGVRTVPQSGLWDCFAERLQALGGETSDLDALKGLAGDCVWDDDVPADVQAMLGPAATGVWGAGVGVTMCDAAVAETGSVVIAAKPGRSRLNSLAPPVHIVLIRQDQIVASLEEGVARAGRETTVIITGPSRTADIEGVLIRGVHGPGRVIAVLLPG